MMISVMNCWVVEPYTGHQVRTMATDNMEGTHNLFLASQNESKKMIKDLFHSSTIIHNIVTTILALLNFTT